MIRVVFFAQLREQLKTEEVLIQAAGVDSISLLKQYLILQNPEWEKFLCNSKLLVAINHAYAKGDAAIRPGDEVAFFPPVTGG